MTKNSNSPSKEEETVKKINSIKVIVGWNSFSPDCRQWKPSTPILIFDKPLPIVVYVPLTNDLIDNASIISMAHISNQAEPSPLFTPLGMRYIIDQFESAMKNGEPKAEETAKTDEWEEEDLAVPQDNKPVKSDEEVWEDEDTTTKSKEDEDKPWDEDWDEDK